MYVKHATHPRRRCMAHGVRQMACHLRLTTLTLLWLYYQRQDRSNEVLSPQYCIHSRRSSLV